MSAVNNNTSTNSAVPSYVQNAQLAQSAAMAAAASGSTPVMTFQHAPYGYSAVPEQFRTIQPVTPPRTPPMAPAHVPTDSLGPLGEAQSSTTSFDFGGEGGEHPEPLSSGYTPYPQQHKQRRNSTRSAMLPPPVQHLCPARGGSGDQQHLSATVYDQSGMPPPPPPSYTVSLHSGANPCSPTFPPAKFPIHPSRPQLCKAYPVEKEADLLAAMAKKDGLDLEAAKKRMFVAHHHLEKTETPYYQLPFGKTGKLPTPAHWPSHCSIDGSSMYPNTYRAFIGQVRFETTTEQIAWVLERVTGVTPAFVAYHRNGCFVAHFLSEEECNAAVSFHKKILFDLHGVWNLKSTNGTEDASVEQHRAQQVEEALRNKPNLHKYRLPRGCMVIERFTSTRSSTGMPAFPNASALQPSPCHPAPNRQAPTRSSAPTSTAGRKMSHLTIHQQLPPKSTFDAIDAVSVHCRGNSM